jgi:hypothetical protein
MATHEDLLALERAGWKALSVDGDAARFYAEVLARQVLMLLPGGLVIDDRNGAIDATRGAAWTSFELSDERVHDLTDRSAVVAYRGAARRGDDEYMALFTSTYVLDDGAWRLAVHQQTPI